MEFADDNFKFDENGRNSFKRVENTVGKGEIARYEQFLLFPQCFQKACFPGVSKGVIVWEWVKQSRALLFKIFFHRKISTNSLGHSGLPIKLYIRYVQSESRCILPANVHRVTIS